MPVGNINKTAALVKRSLDQRTDYWIQSLGSLESWHERYKEMAANLAKENPNYRRSSLSSMAKKRVEEELRKRLMDNVTAEEVHYKACSRSYFPEREQTIVFELAKHAVEDAVLGLLMTAIVKGTTNDDAR